MLQNSIFPLQNFFWKTKHELYNFAPLFGTSITLLQLLIFLLSSFHACRSIHWCFRKKVVLIFEVLIHHHFKKKKK